MRRVAILALALCLFLSACGGGTGGGAAQQQPATAIAAAPVATATVAPTPTIKPTATATPKPPTMTPTPPRATPTRAASPTAAVTPTVAPPAVAKTVTEPTGRCQVGLPAGFVATEEKTDTWYSTDRSIVVTLAAPESAATPSINAATTAAITGLRGRLGEFQQVAQEGGAGARRIDFVGKNGELRAWGTLYMRQFGLDYCQLTVIANAGTTVVITPAVQTMTGSLTAMNPRPAPAAYLALGDSYAAGVGATDPTKGGYAPRLVAALNDGDLPPIGVKNLAISGATSADFLGDWATAGKDGTSPLAAAVRALEAGGITLVTIEIGGNDILRLLKPGGPCAGQAIEGDPCLAAMRDALATVSAPNLPIILAALVEAAPPGTRIVVVNYPNAFSTGQGTVAEKRTDLAIGDLNALIAATVNGLTARVAERGVVLTPVDIAPLFATKAGSLTHILDPTPDIHPNDAGYAIIAGALVKAVK